MNVIAVVVTFNRCELLKLVLTSLLNQTKELYKVIIIDNNSKDNTSGIVNDFIDKSDVFIYHNTRDNLGGAGGFHEGFKIADKFDYDYLWLMDDDFLPDDNCLEQLVKNSPEGIAQPLRFDLDGLCAELSPVTYDLNKIFCKNPKLATVADIYSSDYHKNNEEINIAGVPFEGPLISRALIDKIGYPNPDFFIFNDDLDYSLRAREQGFTIKCHFDAKAKRLFKNNQNNDLNSWKGYFMLRNHYFILRKYGGNIFVRNRSFIIAGYYMVKSIISFDLKFAKVVYESYRDSFKLKNSKKFRP